MLTSSKALRRRYGLRCIELARPSVLSTSRWSKLSSLGVEYQEGQSQTSTAAACDRAERTLHRVNFDIPSAGFFSYEALLAVTRAVTSDGPRSDSNLPERECAKIFLLGL